MNCGEHEVDCSQILDEVWLFLDNECDARQRSIVRQHLDECTSCLEQYGIDEHLKALLARKCGGDQASIQFKERLRVSIRQTILEQSES